MFPRFILAVLFLFPQFVFAASAIELGAQEDGRNTTGQLEIWHDPKNEHSLDAAVNAYRNGEFKPLTTAGSTGLKPGSFWSHFILQNTTDTLQTYHLEYVDHQLIALDAFVRVAAVPAADSQQTDPQQKSYQPLISLSLANDFSKRPISHNRFVFAVDIPAKQSRELLVKYSSDHAGFVFPALRIWTPAVLRASHTLESGIVGFMFGGIFLMSVFALVAGVATQDKTFYIYAIYAVAKIISWCTILGYTHQYLIPENFHWRLMSISGAFAILCGLAFSRSFLQTRVHTRKLDYVLIFMMANATFLLVAALFKLTALAVISITLALLLFPMITVAGLVRWRQGSKEAGVFALAWSLLVVALVCQALRDLGLVSHNYLNYYWPVFASFFEMLAIMAAMGMQVQRLRHQKDLVEHKYLAQLENSKVELERQVWERTRDLEKAKLEAELEARTDPLTGVYNRRSFFVEAGKRFNLAQRKQQFLSLMMLDIDYFKSINDTFGHSMGDEALREFSKTIVNALRESDVFGRLGGEEFALVLSEDKQGTLQTAQRLRAAIAGIVLHTPQGELRLTASIGIAHMQDEPDIEALLYKADHALYAAKHRGRDQIIEHGVA